MVYVAHVVAVLAGLAGVLADCHAGDCLRALEATPISAPVATTTEPCAVVSSLWAAQREASPLTIPTVAAELAHECLKSIPLGRLEAVDLVESIVPYLEWQSDSAYLANPPKDYPYPGHDIFAALQKVKMRLQADKYVSEYEFQSDLYETVFAPAHDGHFIFYPDALSRVFTWRRQRSLVSISENGTSLPVIKVYEDVMASPNTASVVTQINGIDAATYIQDTINKATYNQDPDAAYNTMFYELATEDVSKNRGYFTSGGRVRFIYQGPNTTFTFANGTSLTLENKANILANLTGVTDGAAFYKKFCTPHVLEPPIVSKPTEPATAPKKPGYPKPVVSTRDGSVAGYFLNETGFEDVAVIELLAFGSETGASPEEFQNATRQFLAAAKAAGKKKLLISFFDNGGGIILLGYDFFRQLFPHTVQDGFSRWKENDGFMAMAQISSALSAGVDPYTDSDEDLIDDYEIWFNYRHDLNLTNQPFDTFGDKFDAHVYKNTPYTSIMRWNLNNNLTTTNETFGLGIEVAGYGDLTNITQPFAPEDIVILYDGVCASTCTLAAEMLQIQGGVKSIAFGGRPTKTPIQGMGGVKGAQVLDYGDIWSLAQSYAMSANKSDQKAALERYQPLPFQRSTHASVNVRDQILRGNIDDGVPAQFVQQEADCRLYWTQPMLTDATAIWKAAAEAAYHGKPCVAGGFSRPNASTEATKRVAEAASGVLGQPVNPVKRADTRMRPNDPFFKAKYVQKAVP